MGVKRIDIRDVVKSVVMEVVKSVKLEKEKNGKLLFVFCDSSEGEHFSDQFIQLRNANVGYDTLYLDGETSSWLAMNQIESTNSNRVIAVDENAPSPMELAKEYDGIIIPEIDLDGAGRVAQGLKGTIKSELVFAALLLNKFILSGDDLTGIKRTDRRCLEQVHLPAPYQKLFERYLQQMKELGIEFISMKEAANTAIDKLGITPAKEENDSSDQAACLNSLPAGKTVFEKKLLTPAWIQSQKEIVDNTIYLSNDVIISPLAKDLVKEKKLTIKLMN